MSFRLRIMTLVGGALLLAFVGLGYALFALFDTRDNFASFVDNDLVELQAYQEMYAQGLQMGQALRNMLLDPANPQALKNLNKGSEEFDAALALAGKAAATSGKGAVVQAITELRQKRKAALDKVLAAAAGDRAKAVEILNAEETPAWREIRKQLLDTLEASKKQTVATKAGMIQRVDRAVQFGLGLGLVSLIVAVVLIERLLRNLRRELGGEPSAARAIMHRVAEGDFTVRIEGTEPGSLLAALADMVASLRGVVAEIERQAEQLAVGAEEVSRVSARIAEGAEREAEAASGMAATIEEFTVSAAHISASASDTRSDSEAAAKLSQSGEARVHEAATKIGQIAATVDEASGRIRALDERAGQVSAITAVIKDIAGQTNLLALNAAIEAARAGELGRGFAVVADEVRKLAERTSTATVEIEAMIGAIQGDTEAAVRAMAATGPEVEAGARLAQEASAALNAIREGAARTLARVHEMADATGEQSSASTVIAQQVEQVARMVEETSAAVHTTAQTAASLEAISQVLKSQVQRFRV